MISLENNDRLKVFTIYGVQIMNITNILERITSTQLSRLTLIPTIKVNEQIFDRSRWDAFLSVILRPVFEDLERVEIILSPNGWASPTIRRCIRKLNQMLLEWLMPIKARAVLEICIDGDAYEKGDGPYIEGEELGRGPKLRKRR